MEKYAECPLCCETFSKNVIEAHASTCGLLQQSSQPVKRSFASIFTSPNSENEKKRAKVSKPAKTPPSSSLANNKLSLASASPQSRRDVDDVDPMLASNQPVEKEGGKGESAGETRNSGTNVSERSLGVPLAEALRPKVQNLILACIGIYFFKSIFFIYIS